MKGLRLYSDRWRTGEGESEVCGRVGSSTAESGEAGTGKVGSPNASLSYASSGDWKRVAGKYEHASIRLGQVKGGTGIGNSNMSGETASD